MLAIGNEELEGKPFLGKTVKCWICGKRHEHYFGKAKNADGVLEPCKTLSFMKCPKTGSTYLCGIDGKEFRPKGM